MFDWYVVFFVIYDFFLKVLEELIIKIWCIYQGELVIEGEIIIV